MKLRPPAFLLLVLGVLLFAAPQPATAATVDASSPKEERQAAYKKLTEMRYKGILDAQKFESAVERLGGHEACGADEQLEYPQRQSVERAHDGCGADACTQSSGERGAASTRRARGHLRHPFRSRPFSESAHGRRGAARRARSAGPAGLLSHGSC